MTDHYVERPVVQQEPFIMLCGLGYDGFTVAQSDTWGKHRILLRFSYLYIVFSLCI